MTYFGFTQQCAEWMLDRKGLCELIHDTLRDAEGLRPLQHADIVEGPLRVACSGDGELLAIWNIDYLSGTGEEPWGFIRLAQPVGLFGDHRISKEVFERCLYVANQRLQALLIDGAYIHRTRDNGVHT